MSLPEGVAVELYEHKNYSGKKLTVTVAEVGEKWFQINKERLASTVGDDSITSVRVASGYMLRLYVDDYLGGDYDQWVGDCPNLLEQFNDKVSSVEVLRHTEEDAAEMMAAIRQISGMRSGS